MPSKYFTGFAIEIKLTLDQGQFNATGSKAAKAQCHKCGIFPIIALLPDYFIGFTKIFSWNWQNISSLKLAKYFLQINVMERCPTLDQGQSNASGIKVPKRHKSHKLENDKFVNGQPW